VLKRMPEVFAVHDYLVAAVRQGDGHKRFELICRKASQAKAHAVDAHIAATRKIILLYGVFFHDRNRQFDLETTNQVSAIWNGGDDVRDGS